MDNFNDRKEMTMSQAQEVIRAVMTRDLRMAMSKLPSIFSFYHLTSEDTGDSYIETYSICFKNGNCKHEHKLMLTCNIEDGDIGIDYNTPDGDLGKINPHNIMTQLYLDLALKGLDDKYME